MSRFVVMNRHQIKKGSFYDEIGLCAHNLEIILGSCNCWYVERASLIAWRERESSFWPSMAFASQLRFWNLKWWSTRLYNCLSTPHDTISYLLQPDPTSKIVCEVESAHNARLARSLRLKTLKCKMVVTCVTTKLSVMDFSLTMQHYNK